MRMELKMIEWLEKIFVWIIAHMKKAAMRSCERCGLYPGIIREGFTWSWVHDCGESREIRYKCTGHWTLKKVIKDWNRTVKISAETRKK